ncbi:MAG TPA: hypothetical protein VE177_04885, partial [Candidatus Binatus sp.]|nr:hypothetical protein [Candidatus Binatus sp.]
MKNKKLLLAIIALIIATSPILVLGVQRAMSKPVTAAGMTADSDETQDTVATMCTHVEHEHNETGTIDHEDETATCHQDDNDDVTTVCMTHSDNESVTGAAHEANQTRTCHEEANDNASTGCGDNATSTVDKTCVPEKDNDDASTGTDDSHEVDATDVVHTHPTPQPDHN